MKLTNCFPLIVFVLFTTGYCGVHESTGNMVLSENLVTIDCNTISLPLNLSCKSGIRVNQHASWVGLGFDLSLPYVERTPVGSVDEKSGTSSCFEHYRSIKNYNKLLLQAGNGYSANPGPADYTTQQDAYTLNASFAGGRIVFAQPASQSERMVAYLQNWRSIVVGYELTPNGPDADISKWTFVDENGTTYIFAKPVRITLGDMNTTLPTSRSILAANGYWIDNGDITYGDGYVNQSYNFRWYLTEIRAANYNPTTGKGDIIRIDYTPEQPPVRWFDASCFDYSVDVAGPKDEYYRSPLYGDALVALYKYDAAGIEFETATFAAEKNVRMLYPVYPVKIYSDFESAEFTMSPSKDILFIGNKRVDEISIKTKSVLRQKIKFNYDETGLAVNHPYSIPGKGLLKLNSVLTVGADGAVLPLLSFDYSSNPDIELTITDGIVSKNFVYTGLLNHDFYGYRCNASIASLHPFDYPDGQSVIGTSSASASAEAWSVNKVTYGNGKTDEYEYETNDIIALSTNDDITTSSHPLKCGIRVKKRIEHTGIGSQTVTTNYSYGKGYISHNFAIDESRDDFYAWLKSGDFAVIKNVFVLEGASVSYSYCKREIANTGAVVTYFLNPSSIVDKYTVPGSFALKDIRALGSVNSLDHYRGLVEKVCVYSQNNSITPIAETAYKYAINFNVKQYETPTVPTVPMTSCATGGNTNPPEEASNLNLLVYLGFIRQTAIEEKRDGVSQENEIIAYNETNGLPSITRATNSDGKRKLTRVTYAIEETMSSSSGGGSAMAFSYPEMKTANILTPISGTVLYEKASGNANTDLLPADVRSAQATTYSNCLGSGTWSPYQSFSWTVAMNNSGIPDPAKPFATYSHVSGATNQNWQCNSTIENYSSSGIALQIAKPLVAKVVQVLRNDIALPIGSIQNGTFFECGIFTGDYLTNTNASYWDYDNGWEKGNTNTVELTNGTNMHFGEKAIHVIQDYAAGRNNRVYPGKAYTMTAWVKVTNGTINMATDFRYAISGHENDWPATQLTTVSTPAAIFATPVTASQCAGQWKLMHMEIPAIVTSQLDPAKVWYARAWVGNAPAAPTFEAYIDDVRFYPADALISTTYYDSKWQQPLLTVDANNNPGRKIVYDTFGRPIEWHKVDKAIPTSTQLMNKKEYHLMGEN
jgi:hypothetical protein